MMKMKHKKCDGKGTGKAPTRRPAAAPRPTVNPRPTAAPTDSGTPRQIQCPGIGNLTVIGNVAYAVNALGPRTWRDAFQAAPAISCCGYRGELLTVLNERELDAFKTLIAGGASGGSNWVGFTDSVVEGEFKWTFDLGGTVHVDGALFPVSGNSDTNDCGVSSLVGGTVAWSVAPCDELRESIVRFYC
jgi:Lectin C-type domain